MEKVMNEEKWKVVSVCLFLPSGPAGISRGIQSINSLITNSNLWLVLFTLFLSFCHSYRQDGGVYGEARSQKEITAGENIYNWHKNTELMRNTVWILLFLYKNVHTQVSQCHMFSSLLTA